jgi:hypothetical protein
MLLREHINWTKIREKFMEVTKCFAFRTILHSASSLKYHWIHNIMHISRYLPRYLYNNCDCDFAVCYRHRKGKIGTYSDISNPRCQSLPAMSYSFEIASSDDIPTIFSDILVKIFSVHSDTFQYCNYFVKTTLLVIGVSFTHCCCSFAPSSSPCISCLYF